MFVKVPIFKSLNSMLHEVYVTVHIYIYMFGAVYIVLIIFIGYENSSYI
jgi:hypothetical protein